jgi:hypothetical protein
VKAICEMKKLAFLDFSATPLGDAAVSQITGLPHLSVLHLARTKVTNAAADSFERMQALKHVDVIFTSFNMSAADRLRPRRPSIEIYPFRRPDGGWSLLSRRDKLFAEQEPELMMLLRAQLATAPNYPWW